MDRWRPRDRTLRRRADHEDINVAVLRSDTARLLPILAAEYQVWANAAGALSPMLDGRVDVPAEAQQLSVRRHALSPWEVDFIVADERAGRWVWRHDPRVTMALSDVTWVDDDGVRFARAEIVLTHKAKWRTPKDDLDFNAAWPLLAEHARSWLRTTVTTMYPDHPWLPDMS